MELSYENYDILVSRSKYFESYHSYMSSRFNKDESDLHINICLPHNISPDGFLQNLFYLLSVERLNVQKLQKFITHYKTQETMHLTVVLKKTLLIADFFQIPILFEMLFQIYLEYDIKLAPDLLLCLLDNNPNHPQTDLFLMYLSESIGLSCDQIMNMVVSNNAKKTFSTNKLKNKIRDVLRHSKYVSKFSRTLCSVCAQMGTYIKVDTLKYRFMSLTPCCGSLIHNTCVSEFNSLHRCEECTSDLLNGRVDFEFSTLDQSFKRFAKRKENDIPQNYVLPLLI